MANSRTGGYHTYKIRNKTCEEGCEVLRKKTKKKTSEVGCDKPQAFFRLYEEELFLIYFFKAKRQAEAEPDMPSGLSMLVQGL